MGLAINNNKIVISILGVFLMVASCDSKRVYDSYKPLENNRWLQDDSISFEFQITDTISKNKLYFNLRNSNEYLYSNLYVISQIVFPNGNKFVDTLQYEIADKNGKFLGVGMSEIKHSRLLFKENFMFPISGKYKVSVWQAMRKNGNVEGIKELEGITDFGFRIEKEK